MKHVKIFFLGIVFSAVFFTGASTASAQILDGTWFELSISVKGTAVEMQAEYARKHSLKTTAYMYVWEEAGVYEFQFYSEEFVGMWEAEGTGTFPIAFPTEDNIFVYQLTLPVYFPDGNYIVIHGSGQFRATLDKTGKLKNASLTLPGAHLIHGTTPDFEPIFGSAKVKGKTVDPDTLPWQLR